MAKQSDITNTKTSQFHWSDETFSELFDTYYTALCFFADKYLEDMDLSRSVVQDVFVDIWIKREKLLPTVSVKSYLYNAVRNRAIDYQRKTRRNLKLSESAANHLESPFKDRIEEAEMNDRINRAINGLPERCREIFTLCRFEELKYSQVAEKLNISIKTVESQMAIALKRLREKLSDYQYFKVLINIFQKKLQ